MRQSNNSTRNVFRKHKSIDELAECHYIKDDTKAVQANTLKRYTQYCSVDHVRLNLNHSPACAPFTLNNFVWRCSQQNHVNSKEKSYTSINNKPIKNSTSGRINSSFME